MKVLIATKENMEADICDICDTAILKGDQYIIQYATWTNPERKIEKVAFKLHRGCK